MEVLSLTLAYGALLQTPGDAFAVFIFDQSKAWGEYCAGLPTPPGMYPLHPPLAM